MNFESQFYQQGWCRFPYDPKIKNWISHALPVARTAVLSKDNAQWLRCGGTWFVGVNALLNDALGSVGDSGPLAGNSVDFITTLSGLGTFQWDRAQISIYYPGYPALSDQETEKAYAFRKNHDAAHIDGLLPQGPGRRRHLGEIHAFILGIPMVNFNHNCSPFVVWEKSHKLVRGAFINRLKNIKPQKWGDEDVTDIYQQTRREVFKQCKRVEIYAQPGETFLVHRHAVHGVAPWTDSADPPKDGRMICYFRPELLNFEDWLNVA